MEKNYRIYSANNLSYDYNHIQKESLLSVGLMDTGNREDFEQSVEWFYNNFSQELYVITYEDRIEDFSMLNKYKKITYIIFKNQTGVGERINVLSSECTSAYFFITRTDIIMPIQTLMLKEILDRFKRHPSLAVQTPIVFNKNQELIPSIKTPGMEGKEISATGCMPERNEENNIAPFLGLGFYNRAIFNRIKGYDTEIKNAYWQTLDFGIRCYLYGYKIYSIVDAVIVFPARQSLMEDVSECKGIERLYTKALCVNFDKNGKAHIKKSFRTDKEVLNSEVKPRSALYKTDYKTLCAFWKK